MAFEAKSPFHNFADNGIEFVASNYDQQYNPLETSFESVVDELKGPPPVVNYTSNEFHMNPDVEYYVDPFQDGKRAKPRPHIMSIIEGTAVVASEEYLGDEDDKKVTYMPGYNFGWIEGVFIRCTLSIFGVLMFLRLNWMFAQAGVDGAIGIIIWSVAVTTLTTMSLSALSTNGIVKGGGVYYMVSRSLGAEFGGVVGITLFIAQSAAVSLHLYGFGEAVTILEDGEYVFGPEGDPIFYGIIGLVFVLMSAFLGANFEVQSQKVLAVSITIALFTFYLGTFLCKNNSTLGTTPLSGTTLASNLAGKYSEGVDWLIVFGVFFPACTGISAGSSISGDLKDPQEAIPKGTFLSIALTTVIYVTMGILMCACFTPEGLRNIETQIDAIDISVLPPLMYLGMFAAALSSALALIVGAPRVLQAVARDNILPIDFYKKSYFAQEEPLRGYVTVVIIAFICIVALDLNTISPIVTNFYLVQYGLMNYSVFYAHTSKSPGWRPSFKYWSPWLALLGAIMCFISMLMVNWILAFCTIIASVAIYQYIYFKQPDVNWGDSGVAASQKVAVESIYRMERLKEHVKNYRPQFLLFCQNVREHSDYVWFLSRLKKSLGFSIIAEVIVGDYHDEESIQKRKEAKKEKFEVEDDIVAVMEVIIAPTFLAGARSMLLLTGIGKLRPNTVILGFKEIWTKEGDAQLNEYLDVMRSAFYTGRSVCIMRNANAFLKYDPSAARANYIDVYWTIEDGGHTFLIAHLLSKHKDYRRAGTILRVFVLVSEFSSAEQKAAKKEAMEILMRKFRFVVEIVVIVSDGTPSEEDYSAYERFSGEDRQRIDPNSMAHTVLNISKNMKEYSSNSHVIVASFPSPKVEIPPRQYFAMLELLSCTQRPTLLVRGNQQTVLSYHS